jgi:hypothetical protein
MHHFGISLVIIEVINLNDIMPIELKYYSPVAADFYGPIIGVLAFQFMKLKSGKVHILRLPGYLQAA